MLVGSEKCRNFYLAKASSLLQRITRKARGILDCNKQLLVKPSKVLKTTGKTQQSS